jgi:hypothetical protein
MIQKGYPCYCCGYLTRSREISGTYEICPICNWEDDDVQADDPQYDGGANSVSLDEARRNFKMFGAKSLASRSKVRDPIPDEIPENEKLS